jgi:polar amino acid transport system permease protein
MLSCFNSENQGSVCFDKEIMGNFGIKVDKFIDILINKGGYVKVLEGLENTLIIAISGLIIGIIIGTLIATVRVVPKYKTLPRVLNAICSFYVSFFRGTPMVVQLLLFYYVMLPILGLNMPGVNVAIIVFGLNSGAYVSEIMRAGIQSVDPGQLEAGRAVGLPYRIAMMKIVIPQSIKNILPTLGNEFIVLIKETSIVSFIAVVDLTKAFKAIGDATYEYIIPYVMLALVYLVLVIFITWLIHLMERRLNRDEKYSKRHRDS